MTTLKQFALAAALCVAGLTSAHADNSFNIVNAWKDIPGESDGYFAISDLGKDIFTGVTVTHVAGESFVDDFYFNLPEAQSVDFLLQAAFTSSKAGYNPTVSFDSAVLYSADGLNTYAFGYSITTPYVLQGNTLTLANGTYALEISGTTLIGGGSYAGGLGTSPVPEPAAGGLMLAGLAALGALVRRRSRRA